MKTLSKLPTHQVEEKVGRTIVRLKRELDSLHSVTNELVRRKSMLPMPRHCRPKKGAAPARELQVVVLGLLNDCPPRDRAILLRYYWLRNNPGKIERELRLKPGAFAKLHMEICKRFFRLLVVRTGSPDSWDGNSI